MRVFLYDWRYEMAEITSSLEDYIEAVYSIFLAEKKVKAIDVSRKLKVSRASVTEALQKLEQLGLINYGHYGTISMTDEGIKKAKKIIKKHETLAFFFENLLGVEHNLAEETACKIEHVISDSILKKLEKHIKEYLKTTDSK